eukprot:3527651-Amphidinium_carterae.1
MISNDEVTDARYKLRMKLIYLMHQEKVKPEDNWNIDETACRLLPQASRGWALTLRPTNTSFAGSRAFVT